MAKLQHITLLCLVTLSVSACAPSPLYKSKSAGSIATPGTIPRDGNGEPIWSQIPAPADAIEPAAGAKKPLVN